VPAKILSGIVAKNETNESRVIAAQTALNGAKRLMQFGRVAMAG
jgi:hypothetical protein